VTGAIAGSGLRKEGEKREFRPRDREIAHTSERRRGLY
jgi:hypothetical protein